jgi:CDP-glucose 4,6-dehydratase
MSFFGDNSGLAGVATARAGNVVGGGDWAEDRIVPDCIRSWSTKTRVRIRNPQATRPWQHVLEPLSGYLLLAAALWERRAQFHGQSYNFGPDSTVNFPVARLIEELSRYWPGAEWEAEPAAPGQHEAKLLKLSCDKALAELQWRPTLRFDSTVRLTGEWYSEYYLRSAPNLYDITQRQLEQYCAQAKEDGQIWAQ